MKCHVGGSESKWDVAFPGVTSDTIGISDYPPPLPSPEETMPL